jgi:hypothetical protein
MSRCSDLGFSVSVSGGIGSQKGNLRTRSEAWISFLSLAYQDPKIRVVGTAAIVRFEGAIATAKSVHEFRRSAQPNATGS